MKEHHIVALFGPDYTLVCGVCQVRSRRTMVEMLCDSRDKFEQWRRDFIAAHQHEPPKPLTPEEKERIRIQGIHRRGALRCGY